MKAFVKEPTSRLHGLDLARLVAFIGMVIVNFKVVMFDNALDKTGWLYTFASTLEGRAAATFVVLAGIVLGLAYNPGTGNNSTIITLRRAAFLLVIGLLNSLIFEADILHYYAFYFLFGALMISLSSTWLTLIIGGLNILFIAMVLLLDYNTGWDWANLSYAGFWTPTGFVRNLFFNGWHPVVPWLGFLLFGIILSRLKLGSNKVQITMAVTGAFVLIANHLISNWLIAKSGPELGELFTTNPVPPMPLYILAGLSFASMAIGICLHITNWKIAKLPMRLLTPAGRQTRTLYIGHILIGMGTLETLAMLGNQSIETTMMSVAIFCGMAIIYAWA